MDWYHQKSIIIHFVSNSPQSHQCTGLDVFFIYIFVFNWIYTFCSDLWFVEMPWYGDEWCDHWWKLLCFCYCWSWECCQSFFCFLWRSQNYQMICSNHETFWSFYCPNFCFYSNQHSFPFPFKRLLIFQMGDLNLHFQEEIDQVKPSWGFISSSFLLELERYMF